MRWTWQNVAADLQHLLLIVHGDGTPPKVVISLTIPAPSSAAPALAGAY